MVFGHSGKELTGPIDALHPPTTLISEPLFWLEVSI